MRRRFLFGKSRLVSLVQTALFRGLSCFTLILLPRGPLQYAHGLVFAHVGIGSSALHALK